MNYSAKLLIGAVFLGFLQHAHALEDYRTALGALQRLDYDGAAAVLTYLADSGDARAQAALATLLESGTVTTAYPIPPLELLQKAANQGVAEAALELGNRNYLGNDLARDFSKAVDWWRIAAETGSAPAAFNLGLAYAKGTGTTLDLEKAKHWFTQAANTGSSQARFALGVLQLDSADYRVAFTHFEQAASAGLASAQYNLASMYEHGIGCENDLEKAATWYQRAAAANLDIAKEARLRLENINSTQAQAITEIRTSTWVSGQKANHYTLQVATGLNEAATRKILAGYSKEVARAYFHVIRNDESHHLALVGAFASYSDALSFLNSLPPELRVYVPWIRSFKSIQALARDGSEM